MVVLQNRGGVEGGQRSLGSGQERIVEAPVIKVMAQCSNEEGHPLKMRYNVDILQYTGSNLLHTGILHLSL